jgi:hypothetical protein
MAKKVLTAARNINCRNKNGLFSRHTVLVMETGENGFCHDPLAVRQLVVSRPRRGQP